jgi:CheY-like chemotaxis protein
MVIPSTTKILIVEDDPANLTVISTLIEILGFQFDVSMSGCDAVQKAKDEFYPVIIMDMRLQDMDGENAVRLIRKNESKLGHRRSKILCVTADVAFGERERCLSIGMDDYLSKPYSLQELQNKLTLLFEWQEAAI